jgi:hypothetical protein
MKQIHFDSLHKTLKDAVLEREGKDFVPDAVECRFVDQNEYDENLNVTGKNKVVEVYYGCGDFRGSIAPVKVTKALETWFANVVE